MYNTSPCEEPNASQHAVNFGDPYDMLALARVSDSFARVLSLGVTNGIFMPDRNPEQPTFEAALAELQRIVADLENGTVGLEESLARFERGVALLKTCYATLEQAEQRIELLVGTRADGSPLTQPFDASATADAETPTAGRRRSRKAKSETAPTETAAEDDSDPGFLF